MAQYSKVLVTGADGFIGSHLIELMLEKNIRPKAFVFYNSFNSWGWLDRLPISVRNELEVFSGDIRDPQGVTEAMKGCDAVLHLAALIAIPYSYHSPTTYVETNILGTLNVLQAAKNLGVQKIVHTSTSEVYGTAQFVPISEKHPLVGQSPYSASKIGADQIAYSFWASFGTPVTTIRPFNTYGPRQSARAVIPTIISQVLNGARTIQLGSLHPTRDFTYVSDTAHGFLSVLNSEATEGEVINVGSGFEISVLDTAKLIAELVGAEVEFTTHQERLRPQKSEVERLWADTTKAQSLIGWQPQHGGLEGFKAGLKKTIEWFSNPENLSAYKANRYNI